MRLEAKDLSFRYHKGNRQILNHVSVSLDSSDRLGLAAPSGFGKTTFCKILAGYEQPDEGQVLLDGKPLSEYKGYCPVQLIWQHPQEAKFFKEAFIKLTGDENSSGRRRRIR